GKKCCVRWCSVCTSMTPRRARWCIKSRRRPSLTATPFCVTLNPRHENTSSASANAQCTEGGYRETLSYWIVRTALDLCVRATGNPVRFGSQPAQASGGSPHGRSLGSRHQLERAHLRLFAREHHRSSVCRHGLADPGVRSRRQVPPRNRQEPVRLVVRT